MFPVSDKLNQSVRYPHKIATQVDVVSPNGELLVDQLKLVSGFVRVDENREIRRRFNAKLVGDFAPTYTGDLFHPFARNEFRVYRGVEFSDGTTELVPQGVFDMSSVSLTDAKENFSLEVVGYDRARDVRRRRFVNNYIVEPGLNYTKEIQKMISTMRPNTQFNLTSVNYVTPRLVFGGSGETGGGNAWDSAQKMAESIGMQLYFDVMGVCTMKPVSTFTGIHAHIHFHETEDTPNLILSLDKSLNDEDSFNHVVVFGESTSNEEPVKGEAIDDDPISPTYIYGPYGDIPTFFRSEYVTTKAQAIELAQAYLRQKQGIEETIQLTSVVHPALEIGDIIHVQRDRSSINSDYIIDSFTMPLEASQAINIGVRSRRANV